MSIAAVVGGNRPAKKPGALGVQLGMWVMLLGFLAAALIYVLGVRAAQTAADAATAFPADGRPHQVAVTGGEKTGIWSTNIDATTCSIADAGGKDVPFSNPGFNQAAAGGFSLGALFTPASSGMYTATCTATATGVRFKIAAEVDSGSAVNAWGVLSAVVGIVVFLAGLVLFIVSRRKVKAAVAAAPMVQPWAGPGAPLPPPPYGAPPTDPRGSVARS